MRKIKKNLNIDVKVKFIPFPCEDARQEAYRTHARLWLKVKEKMLREKVEKEGSDILLTKKKKYVNVNFRKSSIYRY